MAGVGSSAGASSAPRKKTLPKNAAGNRSDIGWKHGIAVDGDSKKIQCKYCHKIIHSGGVYRLKHHLAGTGKDVEPCKAVPDDVKKEIFENVKMLQENLIRKTNKGVAAEMENEKRKAPLDSGDGDIFKKRCFSTQPTINSVLKKSLSDDACRAIARLFYNNAIPFNVARSEEFKIMCEKIADHGKGFKPPSYHDIRVKLLKEELKSTHESLAEHRAEWKATGCTIMTDGWTDRRRRTIINFLVNSPKGTVFLKSVDASNITKTADKIFEMIDAVVEEVGEDNVIQVVTDNAANYKAAGELLMQKRKKIYWTPCAAHCLDLMLEDLEKKIPVHGETIPKGKKLTTFIYQKSALISVLHQFTKNRDLVRPGATRFATSYLTLGCLHEKRDALIRMFTSKEWKSTKYAKTQDGKDLEDLVLDNKFWKNIVICLKGATPLIKVLRLVDADTPAMGFIYEAMDQAKEEIQKAFNGVKKSYAPLWKIIDDRWDKTLHRPLHAAAYFLNPRMQYGPSFKADIEVQKGLMDCLTKMVVDAQEQADISVQIQEFKKKRGYFGTPLAKNTLDKTSPADWWDSYGIECPQLQKFAIRILSLTCSSSGCERNWSAFEMVHTKRRNRLKQETMNNVVFIMANSKLSQKKKARGTLEIDFAEIESDDDWVMNEEDGPAVGVTAAVDFDGDLVVDLDGDLVLENQNQIRDDEENVQVVENLDDEHEEGEDGEEENEDEDGDDGTQGFLNDYDFVHRDLFGP